jgi:hypothetical protein
MVIHLGLFLFVPLSLSAGRARAAGDFDHEDDLDFAAADSIRVGKQAAQRVIDSPSRLRPTW